MAAAQRLRSALGGKRMDMLLRVAPGVLDRLLAMQELGAPWADVVQVVDQHLRPGDTIARQILDVMSTVPAGQRIRMTDLQERLCEMFGTAANYDHKTLLSRIRGVLVPFVDYDGAKGGLMARK